MFAHTEPNTKRQRLAGGLPPVPELGGFGQLWAGTGEGAAVTVQPDETLKVDDAYFLAIDGAAIKQTGSPVILILATVVEKVRGLQIYWRHK